MGCSTKHKMLLLRSKTQNLLQAETSSAAGHVSEDYAQQELKGKELEVKLKNSSTVTENYQTRNKKSCEVSGHLLASKAETSILR